MKKLYFSLLIYFISPHSFSQGIINDYFEVTAVGTNTATVTNLTGINGLKTLAIGDTVLIIQMQGAAIDESNSASFGTPTLNNAGNHELNVICYIDVPARTVYFRYNLVRAYTPLTGAVQIVTHNDGKGVNVTLNATTATAWNGAVGGVVFVKATGTVTLNGNIDVSAKGFRGGTPGGIVGAPGTVCHKNVLAGTTYLWSNDGCTGASENTAAINFFYPKLSLDVPAPDHQSPPSPAIKPANLLDQYRGAGKGEGIAKYILDKEAGRGPQANGGGGGQTHNSGGGGGGNYGAGGIGGKPWDLAQIVINGGIGGRALTGSAPLKVFMGGGGGAGHGNYPNGTPTPGGIGGGIIIIKCANLAVPAARSISSNGATVIANLDGDSEGGGGAGGSIFLDVTTIGNAGNLIFNVIGGKGGDGNNGPDCIGTGGGGGGGYIYSKASLAGSTKNLNGGPNGVMSPPLASGKPCDAAVEPNWGSAPGIIGAFTDAQSAYKITQGTVGGDCSLPVEMVYFFASLKNKSVEIKWATAAETNNDFFIVERSEDGMIFEPVATVKGSGTCSDFKGYLACDYDPLEGVSYYRLKQVDFDGGYSYTGTASIEFEASPLLLKIYPQPVEENKSFSIQYYLPTDSDVNIRMLDVLGNEVFNSSVNSSEGFNTIPLTLENVGPGLYFVYITSSDRSESGKIIVK